MAKAPPEFATEAALCAEFIAFIGDDWTAYAETAGWDILLVRKADGFQIGVEAKLKLNAHVLAQALEGDEWRYVRRGPDCRAVLVPEGASTAGIGALVPYLPLTVITMRRSRNGLSWRYNSRFTPVLPSIKDYFTNQEWRELCPTERHKLPEFIPDVAAGASAPVQLTQWKVKAIKIAIIAETRGTLTREHFRALNIDHRRWISGGWMVPGTHGFTLTKLCPPFKEQHPAVYAEIAAKSSEWMPAATASLLEKNEATA